MRASAHFPNRQCGVSLIEVLVAIVVLSIGLLGLAGLQASGLRVGQSSLNRSLAAQHASDMIDRLRANSAAALAGAYDRGLAEGEPGTATLAERDVTDWLRRLRGLPSGTGSIAMAGTRVTVVVRWDDRRGAGTLRGGTGDEAAALSRLAASQFSITTDLFNN